METPETVTLRAVYRQEGLHWCRVRMQQLQVGDIFRIEQLTDRWRVTESPTLAPDGVWSVQALHLKMDQTETAAHE